MDHQHPPANDENENANIHYLQPPADGAPPPSPPPARQVTISIKDSRGFEQQFKLKATTPMRKAMDAYSAKVERERQTLRFLFEGQRVLDEDTFNSLDLQDGDSIEVHEEQIGGFGCGGLFGEGFDV